MGLPTSLTLDAAAVAAAADCIDDVAATLYGARAGLRFDGYAAGRAHIADGECFRRRLDAVVGELTGWARSAQELGHGLRSGRARYVEADRSAAGPVTW